MAMSASVLANELLALQPATTEAAAVATLATAYANFAKHAEAGATITLVGVAAGKAAMSAALVGMSSPGQGSAKITQGVQAFWAAVAAGLAASFAAATAITPPPHAGLQAGLEAVFATNTSGALSAPAATSNIANVLFAQAEIGGTVTYPGPVTTPIT